MVRGVLVLAAAVVVAGASAPALAGACKACDKIAHGDDGFCCGKGQIFGLKLASKTLYEALAGHAVDAKSLTCSGCKVAAKTDGSCAHCQVVAANGKFYHSRAAHILAKGKPVSVRKASYCTGCNTAHADNGYCSGCGVGSVAGRAFKEKAQYEAALAAYATITKAVRASSQCEACAVAMVTDGSCDHCRVRFKNGKKSKG